MLLKDKWLQYIIFWVIIIVVLESSGYYENVFQLFIETKKYNLKIM